MSNSCLFAAVLALGSVTLLRAGLVPQAGTLPSGTFGPSAVWKGSPAFVSGAHAACDNASANPSDHAHCFINQMQKAGAPADSMTFTQALYDANGGDMGVMSSFNKGGLVDVAWVVYPLRASRNYGLFFVNGSPKIVNAEELRLLDQAGMQQSGQYQDLVAQFPKIGLWPGDRDGTTWPNSQSGPNNGLQFVMSYPLRNGCPSCAHAGFALFTWNFDAGGKFLGTAFMGLTPPPLKQ